MSYWVIKSGAGYVNQYYDTTVKQVLALRFLDRDKAKAMAARIPGDRVVKVVRKRRKVKAKKLLSAPLHERMTIVRWEPIVKLLCRIGAVSGDDGEMLWALVDALPEEFRR